MNTYRITTTTGYKEFVSRSGNHFQMIVSMAGFDFDLFNSRCSNSIKYGSGIVNKIDLVYDGKSHHKTDLNLYKVTIQ